MRRLVGDNLYAIIASYMMGSGPMKREKGKRSGCREALEVWNKKNENWIQRISSLYVGGKRGEKKILRGLLKWQNDLLISPLQSGTYLVYKIHASGRTYPLPGMNSTNNEYQTLNFSSTLLNLRTITNIKRNKKKSSK